MAQVLSVALVVFVKTPGYSALKTRLAAEIGVTAALTFYRLSVQAVLSVLQSVQALDARLIPYFAVAEADALAAHHWRETAVVAQGEGPLGTRLAHVCNALLEQHDAVVLMGADAPQLTSTALLEVAAKLLQAAPKVQVGPARDGGFWLLATAERLPDALWQAVPYSQPETCVRLLQELARHDYAVELIATLGDVDIAADLTPLAADFAQLLNPTNAQAELAHWLKTRDPTPP